MAESKEEIKNDISCPKGDKFKEKADKKSKGWTLGGLLKTKNMEDASELYLKAAIAYKISKSWDLAGLCYAKAANCNMASDDDLNAKSNWKESGKCYRHINYKKAIESYQNCVEMNLNADRFGQAAKIEEEIGDMLAEDELYKESIKKYEKAAEYFEMDNDDGNRDKRLLKVAKICVNVGEYEKGIKIFKNIAKNCLEKQLLKWKVREYCFNSMLLEIIYICTQEKNEFNKLEAIHDEYRNISNLYESSDECKCIKGMIDGMVKYKIDKFKESVMKFRNNDKWRQELIYEIEKYLEIAVHKPELCELGYGDEDDEKKEEENVNLGMKDDNTGVDDDVDEVEAPDLDAEFEDAPDGDML